MTAALGVNIHMLRRFIFSVGASLAGVAGMMIAPLTVVEPGMLRFDKTGTARSEVDVLSRWSGDMVFIFDGTQAQGLMQQTSSEGLDSVNLVRVTIYDLPGSHLVWIGWTIMMLGMLGVTYSGFVKNQSQKDTALILAEQE